jgi:hypothetical protein
MGQVRKTVLILLCVTGSLWAVGRATQKFFPDDPIQAVPPPISVLKPVHQKIDDGLDFFGQSKSPDRRFPSPAGGINTLGEVPDSDWFTNRHTRMRMSLEELQRGSKYDFLPVPPFEVIGGKNDGIMPGFRMQDSQGRRYFVKGDPPGHPELATAAEAIVARFLYAIGYNTPKNDVVDLKPSELRVSTTAKMTLSNGRSRKMTWTDVEDCFKHISQSRDGSYRVIASLALDGESIGPFRYDGTRPDDPNDITPHENRRDLRGLYVFAAWLNQTDAKSGNTLDTVIEENGRRFIRHHLLDFGSALGSDGDSLKDARFGNEYMMPSFLDVTKEVFTLGLIPKDWERVEYPKLRGIGRFESKTFRPDDWKSDYPNAAFLNRLPDDEFWAAKQVMAFTDDDIRAIVETAQFSNSHSTDYMVATLIERRNKIGQVFFSKVLPLDHFRVASGTLLFDDLAVRYGFRGPLTYRVQWSRFNNLDQKHEPVAANTSTQLPSEAIHAPFGSYFAAEIHAVTDTRKCVSVYVRREKNAYKVVGIDRTW